MGPQDPKDVSRDTARDLSDRTQAIVRAFKLGLNPNNHPKCPGR
jgi:hypothetical protein